ncbi:MAG: hypothetical protein K0Q49_1571 [Haloplasmataceae bacterium]|jgi:hypothetical protein|nr:hypothetical protein [Haloplasmataceae bacterium]
MKNKLTAAIRELSIYYPKFNDIKIVEVVNSNQTSYKDGIIYCDSINKALLYLVNYVNESHVSIDNHFNTFGTMIDLSRNAVFKVEYMHDVIRKKALLGINKIMLYTEDTYEVEGEPYFGYMRGKYSSEEIKDIVNYANLFDIEIIPCIQTLGHLGQFLRWGHNSQLKDLQTVLMTEIDEVYVFIEKLIKSCKEMYQTNKIHIGLDETFGLGFGKYYKLFGYKNQYEIFINHLKKVNEICLNYGFDQVMIWSDMFFRISSVHEEYYDLSVEIKDSIKNDIPKNVELVYWDYYNSKKHIVDGMLKKHLDITNKTIMASGTWIWTKLTYDKVQTDKTALVHIDSCKENNVRQIYFTQWNDDGAPCNYETSFLGVFDMAAYALTEDKKMSSKVFDFIMYASYQDALLVAKLNECPTSPLPLLWDDPLFGIHLNNETAKNPLIIDQSIEFFNEYLKNFKESINFEVNHTKIIAELLLNKLVIRKELLTHYRTGTSLKEVTLVIEKAIKNTELLLASYRKMWLSRYKPFGLDVIQSRLATLLYRYKETITRINEYENNVIDKIDELEEKVGPYQSIRMNHMNIAYSSIHVLSY